MIAFFNKIKSLSAAQTAGYIGLLGFIVNCAVFLVYLKSPISSFLLWDAAHYWDWALGIAGGDWPGNSVFHQPPLYPYLLALFITVFGKTLTPVYFFQSVLSAATAAMVSRLTVSITGSRKTGVVAGLLYVLYGMQLFYSFKILSECVATFLLVLTALLMTSEKMRVRTIAAGSVMGAVLLVKPHFLMAIPLLCGFYLFRTPEEPRSVALKQVIMFVVASGIVVSMATVRNLIVAKEFTLVSQNGGETFYIGNNAHANGTYTPVEGLSSDIAYQNRDVVARAQEHTGKPMSRSEVSRYWYNKAFSWMACHPADWLRLELTKLLNLFSGAELSNMYLLSFERKNITPIFRAAFVNFYLLFPFFFAGCIAATGSWRRHYPAWVLLGVNSVTMLLFFVDERFRVITMPFFIVMCGMGIVRLGMMVTVKKIRKSIFRQPVFIAFMAGLVMLAPVYSRDRRFPSQEWRMRMALGDIAYGKGEIDASLDCYIKASELNKTNCMPAFMVSKAMFAKGYHDVAAQLYRTTIKTVNDDDRRTIMRNRDFNPLREYVKGNGGVK